MWEQTRSLSSLEPHWLLWASLLSSLAPCCSFRRRFSHIQSTIETGKLLDAVSKLAWCSFSALFLQSKSNNLSASRSNPCQLVCHRFVMRSFRRKRRGPGQDQWAGYLSALQIRFLGGQILDSFILSKPWRQLKFIILSVTIRADVTEANATRKRLVLARSSSPFALKIDPRRPNSKRYCPKFAKRYERTVIKLVYQTYKFVVILSENISFNSDIIWEIYGVLLPDHFNLQTFFALVRWLFSTVFWLVINTIFVDMNSGLLLIRYDGLCRRCWHLLTSYLGLSILKLRCIFWRVLQNLLVDDQTVRSGEHLFLLITISHIVRNTSHAVIVLFWRESRILIRCWVWASTILALLDIFESFFLNFH